MHMRMAIIAMAAAAAATAPEPPQSPGHPEIPVFFQATSENSDIAAAALEEIAHSWRDGYATMFVDLATLLAPSDYDGPAARASRFAGVNEPFPPDEVRRNSPPMQQSRSTDPSARIRFRLIQFLARQTDRDFPDDLTLWRDWIWDLPYDPHPDYALFKGAVYGFIDERMREFFPPQAAADIRLDEIVWGGVGVNGIPPLDHPSHMPAQRAEYLEDDHWVFGIALNGEARAYPRRIIAWHELVRDTVGGIELTIVYCTLCGTVIPYGSVIGDRRLTLGTSGLLYRSNKLMFDEESKSLWSTLVGAPVVGPLVGQGLQLRAYPVVTTTWGEWRADHPDTTVLSLDTGHVRDYSEGAAYREYFGTDRLMFQVPELDDRLKNKAEILAIRLPHDASDAATRPLAISADFLTDHPVYRLQRAGRSLVVVTSREGANRVFDAGDVRFEQMAGDGNAGDVVVDDAGRRWRVTEEALVAESDAAMRAPRVAAFRAFWFGWYAQFPDTELIR